MSAAAPVRTPHESPSGSPFIRAARPVERVMALVLLALIPALLVNVALVGCGVLVQFALAVTTAVALEAAVLALRGRDPRRGLCDLSVVVLAALFVIAVPPAAPWWFTVAGTAFAVLIAKHAYGGLGGNVFNPAMAGYAFVLLSYPAVASAWPDPGAGWMGPGEALGSVFAPAVPADAVTGATVLDFNRTQSALMIMRSESGQSAVHGILAGRDWEWVNLAYLVGGVWLLFLRVIPWRIPAGVLAGVALPALVFYGLDPDLRDGPLFHVFAGAALPAAFFIATDPVSSPSSPRAMLAFGFGVGVLTYALRAWGAYPDGVAFAILMMNAFAPLLDRVLRPVPHGRAAVHRHAG